MFSNTYLGKGWWNSEINLWEFQVNGWQCRSIKCFNVNMAQCDGNVSAVEKRHQNVQLDRGRCDVQNKHKVDMSSLSRGKVHLLNVTFANLYSKSNP